MQLFGKSNNESVLMIKDEQSSTKVADDRVIGKPQYLLNMSHN